MSKKINLSRRRFGKLIGAGAAGIIAAPFIGGIRRAHAARGSATACIRFFLNGGARTSVLWDAKHSSKYNPYGQKYTTPPPGVDPSFFLGALWPDSMVDVLPDISVVRSIYHGDGVGTSHGSCQQRILTGGTDSSLPGWATTANRELFSPLPGIQIGDTNSFAEQLGSLGASFSSIEIPNARAVEQIRSQFLAGLPSEQESRRIARLRDSLSKRSIQRTANQAIRDLPFQQNFTKDIIEQLTTGAQFDISQSGDGATLGRRVSDNSSISNGELRPLFGVSANGAGNSYGGGAMLATRLVQSGVRSVTIERGGWDTHGNETNTITSNLADLGQAISALITTLKNMQSISGNRANALEDTLIVVDTEFSRDNTGNSGFNANSGSDHTSNYAKILSVMFAGGGIAGGQVLGATDDNFNPVNGQVFHSSRVNATIYDLLGISSQKYLSEPPLEALYS